MKTDLDHIDCLVQDCSIPSALTMEILPACTKPSRWPNQNKPHSSPVHISWVKRLFPCCQLDEPYASLVTTSRMQQCFNVLIDIYHEFLYLFYCCVLLEINLLPLLLKYISVFFFHVSILECGVSSCELLNQYREQFISLTNNSWKWKSKSFGQKLLGLVGDYYFIAFTQKNIYIIAI